MKLHLILFNVTCIVFLLNVRAHDQEEEEEFDEQEAEGNPEPDDSAGEEEPPEETVKEKINYTKPVLKGQHFLVEHFESVAEFKKKWIVSGSKKGGFDSDTAKYDGSWIIEEPKSSVVSDDLALVLKSRAKHHAVSRYLQKPFEFKDKPLVVQYEVKFQDGQECGGAYVKLLEKEPDLDLSKFNDKTSYSIMFGPDKCGNDHKLHFIYRYKNPITGELMEKHAKKPSATLTSYFTDKKTHLYTLVVSPDNYFRIYVDQYEVNSGSLLTDVEPPLIPDKEIKDPNDKQPADWDDREKIPDPEAVKPDDWDESEPEQIPDSEATKPEGWLEAEPQLIPDPKAEKPSDWDEEMDGEWEAPLINNPACESASGCGEWKAPMVSNPKYKGKWSPPLIDNPNYKGVWEARTIENPEYFEDNNPFVNLLPIAGLGLELWSMSNDIAFDNFVISDEKYAADDMASQTWLLKKAQEGGASGSGLMQSVMDVTEERPWLWAVIVVVIVLPIILLVAYCCFGSSSSKSDDKAVSEQHRKKTDEPSPDDEITGGEEEEEGEEVGDGDEGEAEELRGMETRKDGGDAPVLGEGMADGDNSDDPERKVKRRTKADLESKTTE